MSSTCKRAHFPSTEPCRITAEVKNRNGTDRWWCGTHGAPAWGKHGERLDSCSGVINGPVSPRSQLRLDLDEFPGGVGLWGALPGIMESGHDGTARGVHVHARERADGPKCIDETFDTVTIVNGSEEFEITGEAATALVAPKVLRLPLKRLTCPRCQNSHLDVGEFSVVPHVKHQCNRCGRHFFDDGKQAAIANPLAELQTELGHADARRVRSGRSIAIRTRDFGGGISIWGSNPALLWTRSCAEETGIHVHAWSGAGTLLVDDTFRRVAIDGIELRPEMVRTLMLQRALPHLTGKIRSLECADCGHPQFDRGTLALRPHHHDSCEACGRPFVGEDQRRLLVCNPLVAVEAALA